MVFSLTAVESAHKGIADRRKKKQIPKVGYRESKVEIEERFLTAQADRFIGMNRKSKSVGSFRSK
jgi:hypothetical protein